MRVNLIDLSTVQKESWDGLMPWFVWMLEKFPHLQKQDPTMDRWWQVANRLCEKHGIVPSGDHIWLMRDFC